jgi:hypothetical protein
MHSALRNTPAGVRHLSARSLGRVRIAAVLLTAAAGGAASAGERWFALAETDPQVESWFTIDFGEEYGGARSAYITQTSFVLDLLPSRGVARFVEYHQNVEPLELPGGHSTGNMVITVVPGSSGGSFDASTDTFTTQELYRIDFDGDLSFYDLYSPIYLPGASSGALDRTGGKISQRWEGEGELDNPFDPENPIRFEYVCTVNTVYEEQEACDGDVNRDEIVALEDLAGLLASFGHTTGEQHFNPLADFDGSGTVDGADLAVLLAAFGRRCD